MKNENTKLVVYDSTDEEKDDYLNKKNIKLPDFFFDLYQVKPMMGDNPIFHEGRKRTHLNAKGCWPSHVYIRLTLTEELRSLLKKIHETCVLEGATLVSLLEDDLGISLSLHVSLSKPFMLTYDMIDSFKNIMKESLIFESFDIDFSKISIFTNEDSSRIFLVIIVNTGEKNNPQFHASIAWSLEQTIMNQTILNRLNNEYSKLLSTHKLHINEIKVKIGNMIHSIKAIS
ncbi:hypothetical protein PORY_000126 [Pneumocystis oryctolagi]|uniref:Uncharacterized protein n=1 Tax=Pneumocystis oryctolagi TaxID=42067 RepID=A0ACB7CGD5_9ASCO|nr:hypothetical protein PORY_000126 [Pneumocystis oryctolagi]